MKQETGGKRDCPSNHSRTHLAVTVVFLSVFFLLAGCGKTKEPETTDTPGSGIVLLATPTPEATNASVVAEPARTALPEAEFPTASTSTTATPERTSLPTDTFTPAAPTAAPAVTWGPVAPAATSTPTTPAQTAVPSATPTPAAQTTEPTATPTAAPNDSAEADPFYVPAPFVESDTLYQEAIAETIVPAPTVEPSTSAGTNEPAQSAPTAPPAASVPETPASDPVPIVTVEPIPDTAPDGGAAGGSA